MGAGRDRLLVSVAIIFLLLPLQPVNSRMGVGTSPGGGTTQTSTTPAASGTCLDGGTLPSVPGSLKVALVQPIFTATPYSQYNNGSFYAFYSKYGSAKTNITSNLGLLSTPVSEGGKFRNGWGFSIKLYQFMDSKAAQACGLFMGRNVVPLSDINVSEGDLFSVGGVAKYSVVVVGFEEYVTLQEYSQLQTFVASGGRLVIMGGDDFVVRVDYNPSTGNETYVVGHGFDFNGVTAWRTSKSPFESNNTNWVGSNYCCFHTLSYTGARLNQTNPVGGALAAAYGSVAFQEYVSHEEAAVTNSTSSALIGTFVSQGGTLVAAYAHRYRSGSVVCICIFADDIITSSPSAQYFLILAIASTDLGLPAEAFGSAPSGQWGPAILAAGGVAVLVAGAYVALTGKKTGTGSTEEQGATHRRPAVHAATLQSNHSQR